MRDGFEARLSDGSIIWMEEAGPEREREVSFTFPDVKVEQLLSPVLQLCRDVSRTISATGARRATVAFGVGFKMESTGVTALVAKGAADSSLRIELEWQSSRAE